MEDKLAIKKAALIIGQKLFSDLGNYRDLLQMSGYHDQARDINEAMILVEKAGLEITTDLTPQN
jgi:hypothetical protein